MQSEIISTYVLLNRFRQVEWLYFAVKITPEVPSGPHDSLEICKWGRFLKGKGFLILHRDKYT